MYFGDKSLRELQYEYNRRQSAMLELDYKQGLKVPTHRWVITQGDLRKHKLERELQHAYSNAYSAWDNYFGDNNMGSENFERFGTAPVRDSYWKIEFPKGPYVWKDHIKSKPKCVKSPQLTFLYTPLPQKSGHTMVFRRYENLIPELERAYYNLDILVKALLGFPETVGYKQGNARVILNDSWQINLIQKQEENIMMDAFLKGFAGQGEALKKAWEESQMVGIDVSDELKDLLKVYTDAEEHLKRKEAEQLAQLTTSMQRFLNCQKEREDVSRKLSNLKLKMSQGQKCEGCGEDHDEDEGDDE